MALLTVQSLFLQMGHVIYQFQIFVRSRNAMITSKKVIRSIVHKIVTTCQCQAYPYYKTSALIMCRGVDLYGSGGTCLPQYLWRGTSMVMSPPNILEVMSFRMSTRVTATVCCILTQILCVISQKKLQLLGDFVLRPPLRLRRPGPRWGPQTPSLLLCPPNNSVILTPLIMCCNMFTRSVYNIP